MVHKLEYNSYSKHTKEIAYALLYTIHIHFNLLATYTLYKVNATTDQKATILGIHSYLI